VYWVLNLSVLNCMHISSDCFERLTYIWWDFWHLFPLFSAMSFYFPGEAKQTLAHSKNVCCVACVCVCVDRWGIEAFNTKGLMGTHHMWMVCPRGEIQGCCQDGACWWTHWHQPFNLPSGLSDNHYVQNFFILCACDSILLMWLMMFRTELRVPCVCICNGFFFVIRHVQYADRDMDPAFTVLTKIAGHHFIPCADSELATTWRYKT
jgi:hypothetical protein